MQIINILASFFIVVLLSGCLATQQKIENNHLQIQKQIQALQMQNSTLYKQQTMMHTSLQEAMEQLQSTHTMLEQTDRQISAVDTKLATLKILPQLQKSIKQLQVQQSTQKQKQPRQNEVEPFSHQGFLEKKVVGQVEYAYISPPDIKLQARIDTGANTSSIHALNIEPFERDSKEWVRFDIVLEDTTHTIMRPVSRTVKIIQANAKEPVTRYAVMLNITLGNAVQNIEFTLSDRSQLSYPLLLGRNFLKDIWIVDIAKKHSIDTKGVAQ